MRGVMFVSMSNMCYLAIILTFFGGYCSLPSGYYWLQHVTGWLLIVTGGYCSLPLVTTRSHF